MVVKTPTMLSVTLSTETYDSLMKMAQQLGMGGEECARRILEAHLEHRSHISHPSVFGPTDAKGVASRFSPTEAQSKDF